MFTFLTRPPPEECVYNLIESTVDHRSRGPPIYQSRFSCMVRQEAACKKTGCFKTMGIPKACLCPPKNYLKKHSRAPISIKSSAPRIKISTEFPDSKTKKDECKKDECKKDECKKEKDEGKTTKVECSTVAGQKGTIDGCDSCKDDVCNKSGKSRIPRICCNIMKPPVPGATVPKFFPGDTRNYIHSNVVKALRMPSKKPVARFVFHPKGHVHKWDESGLPRKYVYKDTFGCVPDYLQCIKEELLREDQQAKYDMKLKERDIQNQVRHMHPTEHQAILYGLKTNWEEKFAEFQCLPLNVDTMAKINKKKELEDELKALEKDIQLLERHDHLFVSDTTRSFYLA